MLAGAIAIGFYFAFPPAQDALYLVLGFAAAAAVIAGSRRYRPGRWGWLAIATGLVGYVAGDAAYTYLAASTGTEPFPSQADILYIGGEVIFVLGVAALAGPSGRRVYRPALLDAALVATAAAFVVWLVVLDPLVSSIEDPFVAVVSMAYPILDVVLLGVLARHLFQPGPRSAASILLGAGLIAWLVADLVYAYLSAAGTYASGDFIDAGWLIGYVLVGASALHPSMATIAQGVEHDEATLSNRRLVLVGSSVGIPILVFVVHGPMNSTFDFPFFAIGSATVGALGTLRLLGSLHAARRLLERQRGLQTEMDHRARTDHLTELANRAALTERLAARLAEPDPVALLFLDLDDFKRVNDAFGHPTGDAVLREVAKRLKAVVRSDDDVGRLGGDEFAIIVSPCQRRDEAIAVADRVLEAFTNDVEVDSHRFRIRPSIGIVWSHSDQLTVDEVLSRADIAMYVAKERGSGTHEMFQSEMHDQVLDRARLRSDLEGAVARGEFVPWYQPIVRVSDASIVGVEALARWNHPTRGLVSPVEFIGLAEQSGVISEIDGEIIRTAAADVARWSTMLPDLTLHVNIAPREAADPATVGVVAAAIAASGLEPGRLVVEMTETALIDESAVTPVLGALKDLGVRLSIDDFGSRYAVLTQLGRLPIDVVKLDQSLIAAIETPSGYRLVKGVLRLAESLGLETVAEGVESSSFMPILLRLGCTGAQGYALGRPIPAEAMERHLMESLEAPLETVSA